MAYEFLKQTLRTYRITWFERDKKMSGPRNNQFQEHYRKPFIRRLTKNATALETLSTEATNAEDFCKEHNEAKFKKKLKSPEISEST